MWACGVAAGGGIREGGFSVTGIDISEEKVRRLNAGDSYVGDIPTAALASRGGGGN